MIVGNVLFTALFGVAALAQPAIGRAFLEGASGMRELNADVYGTPPKRLSDTWSNPHFAAISRESSDTLLLGHR
jgi:hypothetical protein